MRWKKTYLTYCTNIHPGETLADVRDALQNKTARIKQLVSPNESFGVGLRLSAKAAAELTPQVAEFRKFLDDSGMFVFQFPLFSIYLHGGVAVAAGVNPLGERRGRNRKFLISP